MQRSLLRRLAAITLLMAVGLWGAPALSKGPKDNAELHAATRDLARLIGDSLESLLPDPLPAPLYVRWKPVDGWSSDEGALVYFSLEGRGGSNGYSLYVAYFQKLDELQQAGPGRKGKAHTFRLIDFAQIGGRMWRSIEWEKARVAGSAVTIPTVPWLESDPGCCPTGTGAIRIQLDKPGRLRVTDIPVKPVQ